MASMGIGIFQDAGLRHEYSCENEHQCIPQGSSHSFDSMSHFDSMLFLRVWFCLCVYVRTPTLYCRTLFSYHVLVLSSREEVQDQISKTSFLYFSNRKLGLSLQHMGLSQVQL